MKKLFLTVFSAILFNTNVNADSEKISFDTVYITTPANIKVMNGEYYEATFRNSDYNVYDYYNIEFKNNTLYIKPKVEAEKIPSELKIKITAPICPKFITSNEFFLCEKSKKDENKKTMED